MRSAFSKSLVILSAAKDPAGSNWMSCFHSTGFFAALRMTSCFQMSHERDSA